MNDGWGKPGKRQRQVDAARKARIGYATTLRRKASRKESTVRVRGMVDRLWKKTVLEVSE
jgi:hypothetical protein